MRPTLLRFLAASLAFALGLGLSAVVTSFLYAPVEVASPSSAPVITVVCAPGIESVAEYGAAPGLIVEGAWLEQNTPPRCDITDELQHAMNKALLMPEGAVVYLPSGTYHLRNSVTVNGQPGRFKLQGGEGAMLYYTGDGAVFNFRY